MKLNIFIYQSIIRMNSTIFHKLCRRAKFQGYKIFNKIFPVQKTQTHIVHSVLALLPEALTLITFNIIIFKLTLIKNFNQDIIGEGNLWIIGLIRAVISLGYIIFQHPLFLTFSKISIIIMLALMKLEADTFQILTLLLEILVIVVWTLKKQKRLGNIDSRLQLSPFFLKQLCLPLVIVLMLSLSSFSQHGNGTSIIILIFVVRLFFSWKEKFYNLQLRSWILVADIMNLAIAICFKIIQIVSPSSDYKSFISIEVFFLFLIPLINFFVSSPNSLIFQLDSRDIGKLGQEQILKYFLELVNFKNSSQLQDFKLFGLYHKDQCDEIQCPFNYETNKNSKATKEDYIRIFNLFIERQMKKNLLHSQTLKQLLIYYLSPSQKIYDIVDQQQYFQNRQLNRIQKEGAIKNDCEIQQRNFKMKDQQVRKKMSLYVKSAFKFWQSTIASKINVQNLLNHGFLMIQAIQQIKKISQENDKYLDNTRYLIQSFYKNINYESTIQKISNPLFILNGLNQSCPTLVIGAQGQKYTCILDANLSFVKASYYSKKTLCTLKIQHLIPPQIKQNHMKMISQRSRRVNFSQQRRFGATVYVKNRLGYVVPTSAISYGLNAISGNKWIVQFFPRYLKEAIMIVYTDGKVLGVNENCVKMGFTSQVYGEYLRDQIFQRVCLSNNSKYSLNKHEQVLKASSNELFKRTKDLLLQKKQDVKYFLMEYYIIEIIQDQKLLDADFGQLKIIEPKKLVSFQFHRDFQGNISDQRINHSKFEDPNSNQFQTRKENLRRLTELSEEILMMRYFKGKLDSVENMDVETDFMDPPNKKKLVELNTNLIISKQHYQQTLKIRNQKTSKRKIFLRISFVLFLVLCLGSGTLSFSSFKVDSLIRKQQIKNIGLYSSSLFQLVIQGNALLARRLGLNMNVTEIINKSTEQNLIFKQKLNQQPFVRRQSIFQITTTSGQKNILSQVESQYLILVSEFVRNQNVLESRAEKLLFDQLYLGKIAFLEQLESNYLKNKEMSVKLIIVCIAVQASLLLVFFILVSICFIKKIQADINKLIHIFSRMRESEYFKIIYKIDKLKNTLFFNQAYDEEQIEATFQNQKNTDTIQKKLVRKSILMVKAMQLNLKGNPENQEANKYQQQQKSMDNEVPRKINGNIPFYKFYVLFILWIVLSLLISSALTYYAFKFNQIHSSNIRTNKYLVKTFTTGMMTWIGVNIFPSDIVKIDFFQSQFYQGQTSYNDQIFAGMEHSFYSQQFITFYNRFNDEDCCQYFDLKVFKNCRTDLFGIFNQGMSQAIAFMNRKLDILMHDDYQKQEFYSKPVIKNIGLLITRYFQPLFYAMGQRIQEEGIKTLESLQKMANIIYVIFVLQILLGIFFYPYLVMKENQAKSMEEILQITPYQGLVIIPEFHQYVKKSNQEIY